MKRNWMMMGLLVVAVFSQGATAAAARNAMDAVQVDAGHALKAAHELATGEARNAIEAMFQAPLREGERQFGVDGTQIFADAPASGHTTLSIAH